ncbi:MAG: ABC transporter ATP-binding protein [Calditrichia bacterium]
MTAKTTSDFSPADVPDVQVKEVRKYFKDVKAVDGISLQIKSGEFVALLGPNGAGKTTLVEMIEGIQKPDSGEILIQGKSWRGHEDELRYILGISLQETFFFDKLTVLETLNLFASFYRLGTERIEYILDLIHLGEKKDVYVVHLSGGQKQKLALGIALLNKAKILLLDEPTTGLDPSARREIWNILMKLKHETQTSLILTSHYMEEAEFLCDRIIIVDKGKILASGTMDDLLAAHNGSHLIEISIEKKLSPEEYLKLKAIQNLQWDERSGKGVIPVRNTAKDLPVILDKIKQQHLTLKSLECRRMTLDDLFISMTGRHLNP